MAPRRLVLTMIFLLAVSTVVAIVAPDPSELDQRATDRPETSRGNGRSTGTTGSSETRDPTPEREAGRQGRARTAETAYVTVKARDSIRQIGARPGQRLVLVIRSRRVVDLAIPRLGRTATADRWAPAVFDLVMPDRRDDFLVEDLAEGRALARIAVR